MLFSSLTFLFVFLPVVMIIYHMCNNIHAKNTVLLLSSLLFYAWGEPKYIVLMIFSTVFDYFNGLCIECAQAKGKTGRSFLILSVIGNLALLGVFKYTNFVVDTFNGISGCGVSIPEIALPIGISFYTFQTMSYTIDVYRKDTKAQHNFLDFAAYVSMFPQLIAGPIVRYKQIAEELTTRRIGSERFSAGAQRFIIGLGKKVIFANQAGAVWEEISAINSPTSVTAVIGAICFTFQIYFDFSGYSDMAIGLGHMLGFTFPENFDHPYESKNITDFWRRWHMTLGSWFREYVYIPLGGNMHGMAKQLRNIFIVWALTGLWHGASWNFVCWGLYYGIILMIEKLWLLRFFDKIPDRFKWVQHFYVLPIIVIGWIIFAIDDIGSITSYMSSVFGKSGFFDANTVFYLSSYWKLLAVMALASTTYPAKTVRKLLSGIPAPASSFISNAFLTLVILLSIAFLVGDSYNPFLYFRF